MGEDCCGDGCCGSKGDECSGGSCCSEGCGDGCCEDGMDMGKMMMGLANEAWSELMKEKMKTAYEKAIGDKMNKTAAVSVEACMGYWNSKMKDKAACAEFEEKLRKSMM